MQKSGRARQEDFELQYGKSHVVLGLLAGQQGRVEGGLKGRDWGNIYNPLEEFEAWGWEESSSEWLVLG